MKAVNFERYERVRRWDEYKMFHKYSDHNALCLFENGTLMATYSASKLYSRRLYKEFDVEITTTRDQTFADPDGTRIPAAWLNSESQQPILIDHARNKAVRLHGWSDRFKDVPEHLRSAAAYINNPDSDPVGAVIKLSRPAQGERRRFMREWAEEAKAVCKAIARIRSEEMNKIPLWYLRNPIDVNAAMTKVDPKEWSAQQTDMEIVFRVANKGFLFNREPATLPFLIPINK